VADLKQRPWQISPGMSKYDKEVMINSMPQYSHAFFTIFTGAPHCGHIDAFSSLFIKLPYAKPNFPAARMPHLFLHDFPTPCVERSGIPDVCPPRRVGAGFAVWYVANYKKQRLYFTTNLPLWQILQIP
jgi:hypothetical protein